MNDNFYDNLIIQIKNLIVSENYLDALSIVDKELNMPYIPTEVENELINFKIFLETKEKTKKEKKLDFSDVLKLIDNQKLAVNEKYEMLNLLSKFNLREYFIEITKILKNKNVNDLLKLKMINELKKQDLKGEVNFIFKNKKKTINLDKLIEISHNKDFVNDSKEIEKFLFKDPITYNFALNFLETSYLNDLIHLNKTKEIWLEVIYIVAKSLNYEEILNELKPLIENRNDFEEKVLHIVENVNFI